MILQTLEAYYRRLAEADDPNLVMPGFSRQNISFCVELHPDGRLATIRDMRETQGKKTVSRKMLVLGSAKPSGSGLNPCTLWDNTAYVLGYKPEDPNPDRTREAFEAFRDKHLGLQTEINDPEFDAVCSFLSSWNPVQALEYLDLADMSTGFGVFTVVGTRRNVHDAPAVRRWWMSKLEASEGNEATEPQMQCLISGCDSPIARIHEPKIQGVNGAQSAGSLLVSFNFDAAESYGRAQSYVAPVSKESAFRYAVALNRLLDRNGKQRVQIGDATTVFWTAEKAPIEDMFWGLVDTSSVENEALKLQLYQTLDRIRQGLAVDDLGPTSTEFYVLGLSPNAARISVRFWWRGSIGEITEKLRLHLDDLAVVVPPKFFPYPSLWQILRETTRDLKDIPPNLSGALMRAILNGTEYPSILLQSLLRRIKADREVSPVRAAVIKACLNRLHRSPNQSSPITRSLEMALNKDRPEAAYQLGRLFAALEKTQEDAFKGSVNASIKDRFFGAASATPAAVFPRLIRLNQHHIAKLEAKAFKVTAERRNREIMDNLETFPNQLSMAEQGLFAIGYYHQRQDFFTKKEAADTPADPAIESSKESEA